MDIVFQSDIFHPLQRIKLYNIISMLKIYLHLSSFTHVLALFAVCLQELGYHYSLYTLIMPRNYKKKTTKTYTAETLKAAVQRVLSGETVNSVARDTNLARVTRALIFIAIRIVCMEKNI